MKTGVGGKGYVPSVGGTRESRARRQTGGPERWALEGGLKGLDLILSSGIFGKFKKKTWTIHPRSRRPVRGRLEWALSWPGKPFWSLGLDVMTEEEAGGRAVCFSSPEMG